jgi:hypothetical protein
MNYRISLYAIIPVFLFMLPTVAHNKTVIIPLMSSEKLANIVTVSKEGGNYTNPVAAVESITDASESNPYLVLIGPGIYTLTTTLVMKPYVSIQGAGEQVTKLTGAISTGALDAGSAIISGADNASLSYLTVENRVSNQTSIALFNGNSSPDITDVTALAPDGLYSYGVVNSFSSPTMTNVTAIVSGGESGVGVINTSSSPTMVNVTAIGGGGMSGGGVINRSSSPIMNNVIATAVWGSSSVGVDNSASSSPTMTNVTATSSGGMDQIGVRNVDSSVTLRHCTMVADNGFGIYVSGGTTRVMLSSILGGVDVSHVGGTLTCVNSDDGVNRELDATCN